MSAQRETAVDFAALQKQLDQAEAVLAGRETSADRVRILSDRARIVAQVREEARQGGLPVVAFRVGGERYAVDVGAVFQVVEAIGLTPLPATPPWVLGAVVARTHVVPVLDLRALLGLQGGGMSDLSEVLVLEHEEELFGIAVEELEGRLDLDEAGLSIPSGGPFRWIAPNRLALLDLARIGTTLRGA